MSSDNKVVIVTGSNKGIGLSIVKLILQRNPSWTVYVTARDKELGEKAVKQLKDEHGLNAKFHLLDVNSLDSIRTLRDYIKSQHPRGINILVNNAGIFPMPRAADSTPDQFKFDRAKVESTVQANYFGALNVCNELFPLLAPGARVVLVSSRLSQVAFMNTAEPMQQKIRACTNIDQVGGIMRSFLATDNKKLQEAGWLAKPPNAEAYPGLLLGNMYAYGMSKLGLNLLATIFQKKFDTEGKKIVINVACPGEVKTDLNPYGKKTTDEGADTIVYLALLPADSTFQGQFFAERNALDHFVLKF